MKSVINKLHRSYVLAKAIKNSRVLLNDTRKLIEKFCQLSLQMSTILNKIVRQRDLIQRPYPPPSLILIHTRIHRIKLTV